MKTAFKLFAIVGMVVFAQSLINPAMAKEKKYDPRVQVKDNKVSIWFFNKDRSDFSVKIYDYQGNIIKKVNLGDALTLGKILDFSYLENTYYRLEVLADKQVLYSDKFRLGV